MGTLLKVNTCGVKLEVDNSLTGEDGCSEGCSIAGSIGCVGDDTADGLRWVGWTDEDGSSSKGD